MSKLFKPEEEIEKKNDLKIMILILALLICLILLLTYNYVRNDLAASDALAEEPTTVLRLVHWISIPDEVLEKFEAENPGVKISYQQLDPSVYSETVNSMLSEGRPPDLVGVPQSCIGPWSQNGYLRNISDSIFAREYATSARESVRTMTDSGEYAVALSSTYPVLWYHQEILDRYGIGEPKTPEELYKACDELAQKGLVPLAFGGADSSMLTMLACGCTNDPVQLASGAAWKFKPEWCLTDYSELTERAAFLQFLQGKTVMAISTSAVSCTLASSAGDCRCCGVPVSDGAAPCVIADNLIGICGGTENLEVCFKFLHFLGRRDVSSTLALENSWIPALLNRPELPFQNDTQWQDIIQSPYEDVSGFLAKTDMAADTRRLFSHLFS